LLSKDRWRLEKGDEFSHVGPEEPLVFAAVAFPGLRERLARAASGPDSSDIFRPACVLQSKRPAADACEEMDLLAVCEQFTSLGAFEGCAGILDGLDNKLDIPNINMPYASVLRRERNQTRLAKLYEPVGRKLVVFVVVDHH